MCQYICKYLYRYNSWSRGLLWPLQAVLLFLPLLTHTHVHEECTKLHLDPHTDRKPDRYVPNFIGSPLPPYYRSFQATVVLPERIPLELAMAVKGENRELLKKIAEHYITSDESAGPRAASYTHISVLAALLLWNTGLSMFMLTLILSTGYDCNFWWRTTSKACGNI